MEGSKNAMYSQAGRTRGWSVSGEMKTAEAKTIPAPVVSAPVVPMPEPRPIPPPPVVVIPEMPDVRMAAQEAYKEAYTAKESEHRIHSKSECETPVMAYIPPQGWKELYETEQGFARGTIFTELDLPFVGEGACRYE